MHCICLHAYLLDSRQFCRLSQPGCPDCVGCWYFTVKVATACVGQYSGAVVLFAGFVWDMYI